MHTFRRSAAFALAAVLAIAGCAGEDGKDGAAGAPGTDGTDGTDAPLPAGPGFQLTIQSATIPATGAPTVTFQALDAAGNPVDVKAETAAGAFGTRGIRFTLAERQADGSLRNHYLSSGSATYAPRAATSFTLAQLADMMTLVSPGVYTFTVPATQIARAFTPSQTAVQTIAIFASRTVDEVGYPAADTYDFTPGTGAVATAREVVTDAACNACHKNMQAHGSRRLVTTCLTCHHTGGYATGEIDFRSMIHQIHNGTYVLGTHDFTAVVFPDMMNGVRNCALCHGGAAQPVAGLGWGCKGCHTTAHQTNDTNCLSCHDGTTARAPATVHASTYDAATNTQFTGATIAITIDAVTATDPAAATVDFTILVNGAAKTDLIASPISQLRFTVGGPSSDFSGPGAPNTAATNYGYVATASPPAGLTAIDAAAGKYRASLPNLTAALDTTVGVGVEAYILETIGAVSKEWPQSPTAMKYAYVGTGTAVARRTITANDKCNACHHDLGFHGGEARKTPEYCAICHNPSNVNEERITRLEQFEDPYGSGTTTGVTYEVTPNSVNIMMMAHKLHAGSALSNLYVLGSDRSLSATAPYGDEVTFAGAFPGDLGDCQTCHDGETYGLPDAANLGTVEATFTCLETVGTDTDNFCNTLSRWPLENVAESFTVTSWRRVAPQTAACTSCHDSDAAKAHAELNTTAGGVESCAVCHGEDATWDALQVHQPAP